MKFYLVLLLCTVAFAVFPEEIIPDKLGTGHVIRIGCPYTGTGRFAYFGHVYRNVWSLWSNHISSIGGMDSSPMFGGGQNQTRDTRYGVEFVLIDIGANTTAEMEQNTALATRQLLNRTAGSVQVIVAPYSSALTLITVQNAPHIPVLAPGASATSVFQCSGAGFNNDDCFNSTANRRFENLFGTLASSDNYPTVILHLAKIRKIRRVGFVFEDTPFGKDTCQNAANLAVSLSLTVVSNSAISSTSWTDMKTAAADLIFGCVYYDTCIELLKQGRISGWTPNATAMTSCIGHPELQKQVGNDSSYLVGPTQWNPAQTDTSNEPEGFATARIRSIYMFPNGFSNPIASPQQFNDLYQAYTGGEVPDYHAASALIALYALHWGVSFGGVTSEAILRALPRVRGFPSFWGIIGFNDQGQGVGETDFITVQYDQANALQILGPLTMATEDFLFPMPTFAQRDCVNRTNSCNGPTHGECQADGTCLCFSPWTGADCSTNMNALQQGFQTVTTILTKNDCAGVWILLLFFVLVTVGVLVAVGLLCRSRQNWRTLSVKLQEKISSKLESRQAGPHQSLDDDQVRV